MPIEMKIETFDKIRQIIYDKSGIFLNESKDALVRARISKRMRKLGLEDFGDYLRCVVNDQTGKEIENLLDAISTNTTSFYREADHFNLIRSLVQGWIDNGQRKLRVWSAASSTGEEPYTLAIELKEAMGVSPVDTKILATDIAPSVLATAQVGEYDDERVAPVPNFLLAKYFVRRRNGNKNIYTVKDVLREMVLYRQFNLSKFPYPLRQNLDIILCRNVMIYFDGDLRKKLALEFERLLRPGGYLLIGHAESLTGLAPGLKCLRPSIYKKE
jgi:chemotaxis protein methyltransferase CheR